MPVKGFRPVCGRWTGVESKRKAEGRPARQACLAQTPSPPVSGPWGPKRNESLEGRAVPELILAALGGISSLEAACASQWRLPERVTALRGPPSLGSCAIHPSGVRLRSRCQSSDAESGLGLAPSRKEGVGAPLWPCGWCPDVDDIAEGRSDSCFSSSLCSV